MAFIQFVHPGIESAVAKLTSMLCCAAGDPIQVRFTISDDFILQIRWRRVAYS